MKRLIGLIAIITILTGGIGTAAAQSPVLLAMLLICNIPAREGPTVRSFHPSSLLEEICGDGTASSASPAACDVAAAIEEGMPCAKSLSMLMAVGAKPPFPHASDEPGLPGVVVYSDLNRNGGLERKARIKRVRLPPTTEIIMTGQDRDDLVTLLGCYISSDAEPTVTFLQNGAAEFGSGAPCVEALQDGLDGGGSWIDVLPTDWGPYVHTRIWGDPHLQRTDSARRDYAAGGVYTIIVTITDDDTGV